MALPEISHIASLVDSGQLDQAKALLNDVLRVAPTHLSATVLLAKMHDLDEQGADALAYWKRAVYLCPGNPVIEKGLRKAVARQLFSDRNYTFEKPHVGAKSQPPVSEERTEHSRWAKDQAAGSADPSADKAKQAAGNAERGADMGNQAAGNAHPSADMGESANPSHVAPIDPAEYQDLDKLISELESARIVPDPDIDMIPQGELETEIDDVVSETLARIYANQKFFAEAAAVYDKLAVQRPEREAEFLQKATDLRQKVNAKS